MEQIRTAAQLMKLDRIRTKNPYSLSVEELAARQICLNSRRISGGVAFARKRHCDEKNIARDRIVSLFKRRRWENSLSILTMPGIDWTFETRLLSAREGNWQNRTRPARATHITAVELDPAAYTAASLLMPRTAKAAIVTYLNSPAWCSHSTGSDAISRYHNCDIFNLMKHNGKTFDAAWIDLTGPLTTGRMDALSAFYERWVRNTLIVTFLGARQSRADSHEAEEAGGVPAWLSGRLPGQVLHLLRYRDGASPMIQYAVRKCGPEGRP